MNRTRYEMCKNWKEKGMCKYGEKCLFAHGEHELNPAINSIIAEPNPTKESVSKNLFQKQIENMNELLLNDIKHPN